MQHHGSHLVGWLIFAVVVVSVLESAGPTLVGLANAAVPLVLAVGAVVVAVRIMWHITNRY